MSLSNVDHISQQDTFYSSDVSETRAFQVSFSKIPVSSLLVGAIKRDMIPVGLLQHIYSSLLGAYVLPFSENKSLCLQIEVTNRSEWEAKSVVKVSPFKPCAVLYDQVSALPLSWFLIPGVSLLFVFPPVRYLNCARKEGEALGI